MATVDDSDLQRRPPKLKTSIPREEKTEDGEDTCRICRGEGTPEQPLYFPCKCSGSIKFVHQDCLMEWLSHSQKKYCELCKTPFRFTKLYDESMPEAVPWPLFMRQLFLHSFRTVARWLRYALAVSIWLGWLPWTIRQIWRGLFWIADGSWLTTEQMQDAANQAYAVHMDNVSSSLASPSSTFSANVSIGSVEATISILVPTLSAILGLFDPKIFLRAILRLLVSLAVNPIATVEPAIWPGGSLLSAQIARPPSLLSDFQSIASATRSPIVNNAFIDILEGQLVCLAIITAFILVFLIREWVINQQPLLNQPDPDPADNPVPPPNEEPRRAVRRRRRHRHLLGANVEQDEGPALPFEPRIRRVATENNILVPNRVPDDNRPDPPQRAASLIPALQEFEDNAQLLAGSPGSAIDSTDEHPAALESPPLQRGVFDDVGSIRRAIEERETEPSSQQSQNVDIGVVDITTNSEHPTIVPISSRGHERRSSDPITIPPSPSAEADIHETIPINNIETDTEQGWVSDSPTEIVPTPRTLSDFDQDQAQASPQISDQVPRGLSEQSQDNHIDAQSETTTTHDEDPPRAVDVGPKSLWETTCMWLWDTNEHNNEDGPPDDTDGSDTVVNIDGDNLMNPAPGHHRGVQALAPAAPQQENPAPNIQNGINVNNQDAVDDAEDLEGIMELLGMEGPIAGMVQNIIFSVFLITLTLSASIWCPYIWGKITLLFVAHPFSVFVRAPLFLISRTADVIVDIGLFFFGILGMMLNLVTKLARVSFSLMAPSLGNYIKPDILDNLSLSLFQKSSSRLEKTFMRAVLGFRPDLPTFSVQAHHVLRVFTRVAGDVAGFFTSNATSQVWGMGSTMTLYGLFKAPVYLGSFLKHSPKVFQSYFTDLRSWHLQLKEDLRPLSFSDPSEIDYSLVHWSSKEKIFCIALGYGLFGLVGYVYLKIAPYIYSLKKDEKVTGFFADTLRQAGGVMKVIIIIGIEMIVFPLYCGSMLDLALLPLFEGATVHARLRFFGNAPMTALFIHWFIGTCYMFHFALFVSMCRKIMRKGVLYFIRDPDDPTFHPVRDVLERPVATQLGKIAFSAFVYGSLLVICLGGVIAGLDRIGGILPLRWGMSDVPVIMPGDIVFFNFVLPFTLRKVDISEKLSAIFDWWFRACAGGLRLSDFMFGIDDENEKLSASFLWRQFLNRVFGSEEKSLEDVPGIVKDLKELAKKPERLLLLENNETDDIEVQLREVTGPTVHFKVIHRWNLQTKVQTLVEFDDTGVASSLKEEINKKAEATNPAPLLAKAIDEIQIDIRHARDTQVDRAAGTYVRAPAKDSVRIPKGMKVFLQVDEKNQRVDGAEDSDDGLHGKKNENFSRIYVPNHFRARILTFIAMVWGFVAFAGLSFSIGPLLLGRYMVTAFVKSGPQVNDLYAFTVGFHALGISAYLIHTLTYRWRDSFVISKSLVVNIREALPWVVKIMKRLAGLLYLTLLFGVVLPLALSFIVELYINVPILTHLLATEDREQTTDQQNRLSAPVVGFQSTPVINLIQTWTLGLLYLRLVVRVLRTIPEENSRPAVAIRRIVRRGILRPDVHLATRALIIPIAAACAASLLLPPLFARAMLITSPRHIDAEFQAYVYRYTYPAFLFAGTQIYVILRLRQKIDNWRVKVRDEVYLIGERLHNFPVQEDKKRKRKAKTTRKSMSPKDKGKARAIPNQSTQTDQYDNSELLSDLIVPRAESDSAEPTAANQQPATSYNTTPVTTERAPPALVPASSTSTPFTASRFSASQSQGPQQTQSPSHSLDPVTQEEADQSDGELWEEGQSHEYRGGSKGDLEKQIDDFKDVTGLNDMPDVNYLGDVGKQVFGASAGDTDDD